MNMGNWNDLLGMELQTSSDDEPVAGISRYAIARNIKGKGWVIVQQGTHCSICNRLLGIQCTQTPGHSWCEDCRHTLERTLWTC